MVNPTIQRRRLGNALRRAREAAGKTQDEAALTIDAASSKISRLELGQSGLRLTDLNLLIQITSGSAQGPFRSRSGCTSATSTGSANSAQQSSVNARPSSRGRNWSSVTPSETNAEVR
ncbi:helix-turn-helix transcriptional regulator [Micromonospora sp. WMMD1102]|uniref:helix-turn-helix domain-containing protein n=1 Tax=Micromonospora sp. WMMD1102 TaxID=3016105 RepID=UPI00241535DE|nr:helix-turn-helix transcriptional regulator [Micromonospora sp. WMMD1102]MDG4785430.1 helix-turn-helix transcriptional regulator [Micromonospora sp. WMMD1102]